MAIIRFLLFRRNSGHIRPWLVTASQVILIGLLSLAVLEIAVLLLGAAGLAPPLGFIDFLLKIKTWILKGLYATK